MYELAKNAIKETAWENLLLPKSKSESELFLERKFGNLGREAESMMPQIQTFFNEVFPTIDWEDEVPF